MDYLYKFTEWKGRKYLTAKEKADIEKLYNEILKYKRRTESFKPRFMKLVEKQNELYKKVVEVDDACEEEKQTLNEVMKKAMERIKKENGISIPQVKAPKRNREMPRELPPFKFLQ